MWKEHLVIRKWNPIPIEYELRAFIFDNKMAALCQYYDEVLYPGLLENTDLISKLVREFFEKIKDLVPIHPKVLTSYRM